MQVPRCVQATWRGEEGIEKKDREGRKDGVTRVSGVESRVRCTYKGARVACMLRQLDEEQTTITGEGISRYMY